MRTVAVPARPSFGVFRSRRYLSLASDERLVEQIRRGNDTAFEVAFERHGAGILSFARHILRSPEDAEDAVQHTFASAYRDLLRNERPIRLKPWLYTIARNRCLSMLRARRETADGEYELATAGLDAEVERRAELRELLADLYDLPEEQRAALLLAEVANLSHSEVARVLGCEVAHVKALVFRARTGLMKRREARDAPCERIREQLANLRGGSLRRTELRHHLRVCPGCREYREQVRSQRQMLAVALPVVPSLGLKSGVLGAIGLGGGSAGGGWGLGLLGAGAAAPGGSALFAKLAIVGVLAGGGAVAGQAVVDGTEHEGDSAVPALEAPAGEPAAEAAPPAHRAGARGRERSGRAKGRGRRARSGAALGRGPAAVPGSRGRGAEQRSPTAQGFPHGRGAPPAPPPSPPVRRGPPEETGERSGVGPPVLRPLELRKPER